MTPVPKIIENLRARLVEEAGRQVEAEGYSATTVRSVAAACGVGVGTVYNYFDSKDSLIAAFMLEDWRICLDAIRQAAGCADGPEPVLRQAYAQLRAYAERHQALFRDKDAARSYFSALGAYHGRLRDTLAQPLRRFFSEDFLPAFLAEALLTWTMEGKPYEALAPVFRKLCEPGGAP